MVIGESCSSADIDFQGKHSEERYEMHFHQHWIRLLWPVFKLCVWNMFIIGIGLTVFLMVEITDPTARRMTLILLSLSFLASHIEFLCRFYRYLLYVIVITDKKVHRIKKTLLLVDDHQAIDLWMIQDIDRIQHGIIQNILSYGTIRLEAQETVLRIHFVPDVTNKYESLTHLREHARSRMNYRATEA